MQFRKITAIIHPYRLEDVEEIAEAIMDVAHSDSEGDSIVLLPFSLLKQFIIFVQKKNVGMMHVTRNLAFLFLSTCTYGLPHTIPNKLCKGSDIFINRCLF